MSPVLEANVHVRDGQGVRQSQVRVPVRGDEGAGPTEAPPVPVVGKEDVGIDRLGHEVLELVPDAPLDLVVEFCREGGRG